jgi:hypothetical protein
MSHCVFGGRALYFYTSILLQSRKRLQYLMVVLTYALKQNLYLLTMLVQYLILKLII